MPGDYFGTDIPGGKAMGFHGEPAAEKSSPQAAIMTACLLVIQAL